jgi:cellobiose phosphorylase
MDGKVAESIFIAGLFNLVASEMTGLAEHRGQPAQVYRDAAARMDAAVRQHGRDGAWFLRAYDHFGHKSVQRQRRGPDFHRAAGHVRDGGMGLDDGRAVRRSKRSGSVWRRRTGTSSSSRLSRATTSTGEIPLPPGYKENAGIFCHNNLDHDRRNPGGRADRPLTITPGSTLGARGDQRCAPLRAVRLRPDDRGQGRASHGEAKNSWLSRHRRLELRRHHPVDSGIRRIGTAAPRAGRPAGWSGFTATRRFRGVTYRITVRREGPATPTRWRSMDSHRRADCARPGGKAEVEVAGRAALKVQVTFTRKTAVSHQLSGISQGKDQASSSTGPGFSSGWCVAGPIHRARSVPVAGFSPGRLPPRRCRYTT